MGTATELGLGAIIVVPAHATDALLGPQPQMVVGESGELLDATPARLAESVAGSQLFLLDAADATDLLSPIAAIYNDTDDLEGQRPDTGQRRHRQHCYSRQCQHGARNGPRT